MTRPRMVEADAKLPHRKIPSRTSGTEVPRFISGLDSGLPTLMVVSGLGLTAPA